MDSFIRHYWDYAEGISITLRAYQKEANLTNAQLKELLDDIHWENIELFPEEDAG